MPTYPWENDVEDVDVQDYTRTPESFCTTLEWHDYAGTFLPFWLHKNRRHIGLRQVPNVDAAPADGVGSPPMQAEAGCGTTSSANDRQPTLTLDDHMRLTPAEMNARGRPAEPAMDATDTTHDLNITRIDVAPYVHDEDDTYEADLHREAYAYLRFRVIPARLRKKSMAKKRKAFTQNIRRRFKLQHSHRTNREELYRMRGANASKKQEEKQSIGFKVRVKWHGLLEVPRQAESIRIIQEAHNMNHHGHNILQARIGNKFFIPGLAAKCVAVSGNNCPVCAKHETVRKKPVESILTSRRGQLVMFDLTKYYLSDDEGFVWILLVTDHFTKFAWGQEFKTKEAAPIAEYLFKIFTDGVCVPERWHADNGGEFKNYHIDAVRELLAKRGHAPGTLLPYTHGLPRNAQCQGLVERLNRTFKSRMLKRAEHVGFDSTKDNTFAWVPYLHEAIRQHNRNPIKMYGNLCPSELMNGCPPEAPDHQSLDPDELAQLHQYCAQSMIDAAAKRHNQDVNRHSAQFAVFEPNDVVLVRQLKKTSHMDKRMLGSKAWTGRALIVAKSKNTNNPHHYQIQWISEGLIDKERAGTISRKLWLSWRMKKTNREEADPVLGDGTAEDVSQARPKATRASASSRSSTSHVHTAHDSIPPVQPAAAAQEIQQIADRSTHTHFAL